MLGAASPHTLTTLSLLQVSFGLLIQLAIKGKQIFDIGPLGLQKNASAPRAMRGQLPPFQVSPRELPIIPNAPSERDQCDDFLFWVVVHMQEPHLKGSKPSLNIRPMRC